MGESSRADPSSFLAEETTTNLQGPTDAIASANRDLANNEPQRALNAYTKILTNISPCHPVAFLNRSLCYLVLGYSHLAAIDAYRALIAAEVVKGCPGVIDRALITDLHDYTRNTPSDFDTWKAEPHCYVGKKTLPLLDCDLSSIRVTPRKRTGLQLVLVNATTRTLNQMLMDIKLKARYRLALSLWKCGGGSKQSALNKCYEADRLPFASSQDKEQFQKLGNQILLDVENEFKEEKEIYRRLKECGQEVEAMGFTEDAGLRSLMKTEFTTVKRELYPWDPHSLSVMKPEKTKEAVREINLDNDAFAKLPCQLELQLGDYPHTVLSLVAKSGHEPFMELFLDTTYVHAVAPLDLSHCDSCGSGVSFPPEGRRFALETARAVRSDLLEQASGTSVQRRRREPSPALSTIRGLDSDAPLLPRDDDEEMLDDCLTEDGMDYDDDLSDRSGDTSDGVHELPFDPKYPRYEGLQICPFCREAVFCSKPCADRGAISGHRHLCSINKQENDYEIPSPNTFRLPSSITTDLLRQLVQRVLANLISSSLGKDQHDFDRIWIRMLCCDLDPPRRFLDDGVLNDLWDGEKGASMTELFPHRMSISKLGRVKGKVDTAADLLPIERIPWSFKTNVLDPIATLFEAGSKVSTCFGYKAALDCRRFDGWVLETLRFRVQSSMRVTRFPRTMKEYNPDLTYRRQIDYPHPITHDKIGEPDSYGRNMWMASLHPRIAGIRKAIKEHGEQSNIQIAFREGLAGVRTIDEVTKDDILLY